MSTNKIINFIVFFAIAAIVLFNIVLNRLLLKEEKSQKPESQATIVKSGSMAPGTKSKPAKKSADEKKDAAQEIIRRTHVERGSDLTENIFYLGKKEIARQTITRDGKYTQKGEIPDGKVKFFDDYHNTSGEEYYFNGRKRGEAKTYYKDGRLKLTAVYRNGELQTSKEYYNNGVLRSEIDYTDARDHKDDTEVGVGKLYFPDGVLKYEWNITNSNPVGFKKAYNLKGELRAETYFDREGKIIKKTPTSGH